MNINEKSREWGNSVQEDKSPRPHYESIPQSCYDFYNRGITEPRKVWIDVILNTPVRYLVTIVSIWALYEIAKEFLEGGRNLDDKSLFGTLLVAGMLLTIAIISLPRVKDTDVRQKENGKESETEPAESGTGGIGPGQNRRTSARNRGTNTNGGSK